MSHCEQLESHQARQSVGQGHQLDGYLHDPISYQAKPPKSQLQHLVGQFGGEYLAGLGRVGAESSSKMAVLA